MEKQPTILLVKDTESCQSKRLCVRGIAVQRSRTSPRSSTLTTGSADPQGSGWLRREVTEEKRLGKRWAAKPSPPGGPPSLPLRLQSKPAEDLWGDCPAGDMEQSSSTQLSL